MTLPPLSHTTPASVIQTGVAAAADGKISQKEKAALKKELKKLPTDADRQAALAGLRAEAPKAAQAAAPRSGRVSLDDFKARVDTDLTVGRPGVKSGGVIFKSGLTGQTRSAYDRLPKEDRAAAMAYLVDEKKFDAKLVKAYLEPVRPAGFPGFGGQLGTGSNDTLVGG